MQLSDCNRILIFLPQFPDIPQKISEYLRTDFPLGANTLNIRGQYKILNINDLHLRDIFLRCNMYHSGMAHFRGQKAPYRTLIWALSQAKTGNIRTRNIFFQTTL